MKAQLIEKTCGDFHDSVPHWGDRMATWAFVHNDRDGLPPETFKVIYDLAAQSRDVSIEVWGPCDIETTVGDRGPGIGVE
ncbi:MULTISPECIES: hypothetical protein, partial [unclassified Thiocapsa]